MRLNHLLKKLLMAHCNRFNQCMKNIAKMSPNWIKKSQKINIEQIERNFISYLRNLKIKKLDWRNHKWLQRFSFYLYTFRFFITYYDVNYAFFTMICRIFCKNGLSCYLAFLVFTFQVNLCSHFFATSIMKGPWPKWTIYKHESNKNKKLCLSVILEFCLSSSVCRASTPAYVAAWNIY